MFAPSVADGGPATATRSRRRQRPKSSDSLVQQPKAKRQRLPLTEQTFLNPDVPQEMTEVKADKIATLPARGSDVENHHAPTPRKEPSARTKKSKHAERAANKGDGSLVLVIHPIATLSRAAANGFLSRPAQMHTSSANCRRFQTGSAPIHQVCSRDRAGSGSSHP